MKVCGDLPSPAPPTLGAQGKFLECFPKSGQEGGPFDRSQDLGYFTNLWVNFFIHLYEYILFTQ